MKFGIFPLGRASQDALSLQQRPDPQLARSEGRGRPQASEDSFGALLEIASVRHARGEIESARATVKGARALISQFADPGMLPSLFDSTERGMRRTAHRRPRPAAALTERELVVLRLLPTRLSTQEIGRELYVWVNTVRTQVQAIYRKLEVATRADAVARARELDLLPGSTHTDR